MPTIQFPINSSTCPSVPVDSTLPDFCDDRYVIPAAATVIPVFPAIPVIPTPCPCPVVSSTGDGAYKLISVLSDDCCSWDLYLDPDGWYPPTPHEPQECPNGISIEITHYSGTRIKDFSVESNGPCDTHLNFEFDGGCPDYSRTKTGSVSGSVFYDETPGEPFSIPVELKISPPGGFNRPGSTASNDCSPEIDITVQGELPEFVSPGSGSAFVDEILDQTGSSLNRNCAFIAEMNCSAGGPVGPHGESCGSDHIHGIIGCAYTICYVCDDSESDLCALMEEQDAAVVCKTTCFQYREGGDDSESETGGVSNRSFGHGSVSGVQSLALKEAPSGFGFAVESVSGTTLSFNDGCYLGTKKYTASFTTGDTVPVAECVPEDSED